MGTDAVKELRQWQRREAGLQEQALRAAARAHDRLRRLEDERAAAEAALAEALATLAATGISRDRAATFLGMATAAMPPKPRATGSRRNASAAAAAQESAPTSRPTRDQLRGSALEVKSR